EARTPEYWQQQTGLTPTQTNGWLVFADPFHLDSESWLRSWSDAFAPLPIVGGLASGRPSEQTTQIYLNGEIFEEGGIAVAVGGDVRLDGVISQGCTPIGADPKSGTIAVGAFPRPGQTIQFQRRDAATGTEDITSLLKREQEKLSGRPIYGACLCSCNGRGRHLFGEPNHDARHVQQQFGPIGLAGF